MVYIIEELVKEYPDWTLHVVGSGKGVDMGIRRYPFVKWFDHIGYPQMRELYRRMDVAMHIAKRDWCPNTVVEFLAAGIPTIVSDCGGGATELVTLVEPGFVAMDDSDPSPYVPVAQYTDGWCAISDDFKTNVQSKLQQVYKGWLPKRVALPVELTSEYVALTYLDFMKEML
jgi:glycosyltransferase involved in cell wall biosynthesis